MQALIQKIRARFSPSPAQDVQPYSMRRLLQLVPQVAQEGIQTVIDIGASTGSWSYECLQFMPKAKFLLIEANRTHEADLSKFAAYCGGIAELLAASDVDGTLLFDDSDAFGGGIATGRATHTIEVPCARVDTLLAKHNLSGPYLLKLDTHGFEIPILQGAAHCLANAQGVIIEVYNHYLTDTSELFYETCKRMDDLGFRPAYLGDVTERPHDGTFWQMDILFVPKSNPLFAHKSYR